jgi:hypothetical protein
VTLPSPRSTRACHAVRAYHAMPSRSMTTGKVPGRLRQWGRAVDGRWVGLVDFTVCDLHGATVARMQRVVVPAEALSELGFDERR